MSKINIYVVSAQRSQQVNNAISVKGQKRGGGGHWKKRELLEALEY